MGNDSIKIKPLNKQNLNEAIKLVDRIFPSEEQGEEAARISFRASLDPQEYNDFLGKCQISDLRYWLAIDNFGKVLGTIGLYCYETDKEEAYWLGWLCVAPEARNMGIGKRLLQFCIEKSKKREKRFLRLWTTTNPDELIAHKMYEKTGFIKLDKEEPVPETEFKKLYYELDLRS